MIARDRRHLKTLPLMTLIALMHERIKEERLKCMQNGVLLLSILLALANHVVSQEKPNLTVTDSDEAAVGLRCHTIQLLLGSAPLKFQNVSVLRQHISWARPHVSVVNVSYRLVRKLKTNSEGEVLLPNLQSGVYLLEVKGADASIAEFKVYDTWQPASCSQSIEMRHASSK